MAGNQVKWWRSIADGASTPWHWLSATRFDSLANGQARSMGVLENHTSHNMMVSLGINLHMASNMPAGAEFDFFAVPIFAIETSGLQAPPQIIDNYLVATMIGRVGDSTQIIIVEPFKIGPMDYNIYIRNRSGVAGVSSTSAYINRMAYITFNPEIQPAS